MTLNKKVEILKNMNNVYEKDKSEENANIIYTYVKEKMYIESIFLINLTRIIPTIIIIIIVSIIFLDFIDLVYTKNLSSELTVFKLFFNAFFLCIFYFIINFALIKDNALINFQNIAKTKDCKQFEEDFIIKFS